MRTKFSLAFLTVMALPLALLAVGCGSGNKEGQNVPIATPSPTGNIQSQILSVSIASPPVVTFTLFDENGNALDPASVVSGGGRVRFTLARIEADGNYRNYLPSSTPGQPGFDAGTPSPGQFATVGTGTYTYTFKTDIDNAAQTLGGIVVTGSRDKTHTVAAQIQRTVTDPLGKPFQQAVNPYLNFVPSGAPVTVTREVVAMSDCNECHFKYGAHGGGRRDVALCVLCHNPGPLDTLTGNPLDLKDLIHKIHYGENLPGNVAGGSYSIGTSGFADVTFPFFSGDDKITGTPIECTKCHRQGFDTFGRPFGKDVARFRQSPTKTKCTTCHNTTTFDGSATIVVTRLNADNTVDNVAVAAVSHAAFLGGATIDVTGANADNAALCAGCHDLVGVTAPYNIGSVVSAHTIAEQSPAIFPGINFQIVSVTGALAGQAPTIRVRITTDNGAVIAPASGSFNVKVGYPAAEYTNNVMENYGQPRSQSLTAATAVGDGSYTITLPDTKAIPATATGVGVVGLEGRATYPLTGFRAGDNVNIGGQAVQFYFDAATGLQVTDPSLQRRRVVDVAKCKLCHSRLTLHGDSRVNSIEECVICHNPDATDKGQRPAGAPAGTVDNLAERPIDFKVMIHMIHTGADLDPSQLPYVIYGFGGSANDLSGATYPQDRKHCMACHLDTTPITFGVPLAPSVLGTTFDTGAAPNNDNDNRRTPPTQAVCTTCHGDQTFTAPHVASETVGTTELCAQCHTTGLLFGPDFAHQSIRPFPVD